MAELEKDARPSRRQAQLPTPATAALKQAELPPPGSPARRAPATEPEAPNSATRRRRAQAARSPSPSASAAPSSAGGAFASGVAAMGDAGVSARTQARKVLGRYTARECALLCEAILAQLRRQATAPGVLEDARSPAHIRWAAIAAEMRQEHRLAVSPRDAQALWKFLAYGESPSASSAEGGEGGEGDALLLAASDSEDVAASAQSVNAKTRAAAAAAAAGSATPEAASTAAAAAAPQLRLYPSYALPLGLPETWRKPFSVKTMLPLTFVAEKFLKHKPGAVAPSASGSAAPAATAAAAAGGASGSAAAPEKKRGRKPGPKPKTLADVEAAKKQRLAAPTPRAAYAPSPTPPAQPMLPRSAFQFFCRMYELDPKVAEVPQPPAATAAAPAAAPPAAKKSYSELQALFSGSPLYVRSQCQKYALEDLDRYNRECVRRRIWEKAMASQRSSLAPSPSPPPASVAAVAAQPRPAPVAAPAAVLPPASAPAAVPRAAPVPAAAAPPVPTPATIGKSAQ